MPRNMTDEIVIEVIKQGAKKEVHFIFSLNAVKLISVKFFQEA
jgi:hypothetical protein